MTTQAKPENPFISLIFNIIVPSVILNKYSEVDKLGPVNGLLIALAFPLGYSIWDYVTRRQMSFISGLGFVSILLTGVFTLVQLPVHWLAVKEAAVPSLIGLAIIISMRTKTPLVKKLLYSDTVINVDLVESKLASSHHKENFEKLLTQSSYLLAFSFLISAILNFVLAKLILHSEPGTPAFNQELGKMNVLSWPVIVLPSMVMMLIALYRLLNGIKSLTGLSVEQILKTQEKR